MKFRTRKKFKGTNALKGGVHGGKRSVNTTRQRTLADYVIIVAKLGAS